MGEHTAIAWTDHTFNPWWGCTKVSPGCTHCYAETLDKRWGGGHWGAGQPRRRTSAANWNEPRKWNRAAAKAGVRRRVFCASMADVFDDEVPHEWRRDLMFLIAQTPMLDWQLLTKRPQNVMRMIDGYGLNSGDAAAWFAGPGSHIWIGTTVEDQARANERIPHLLAIPARVRFLSCEPLLGPVDLLCWPGADAWSGPTITETWDTFAWPEWVPADIRRHVTEFWSPAYGRSPAAWANSFLNSASSQHTGMPRFGSDVSYCKNWIARLNAETIGRGRFVPLWNNIGAVVHADGTYRGGIGFSRGPGWLEQWLNGKGEYRHLINWVIAGGESGHGARPMHPAWARSLRDQCSFAGVPFFFKQWGEWLPGHHYEDNETAHQRDPDPEQSRVACMDWDGERYEVSGGGWGDDVSDDAVYRVGKHAAGNRLDGVEHQAFPKT